VLRPIEATDVEACAAVLERLPAWFGIAEANAAYVDSLKRLPGFVAVEDGEVAGFAAILSHSPISAEISVMAVDPSRHRQGIGQSLIEAVESWCRDNGIEWLHVKTRGPSTFDDEYERTRRFYFAMGFAVLYESLTEWGADNAALILVKHLD
jgi:GNAT superfamily N-acetyltransferase